MTSENVCARLAVFVNARSRSGASTGERLREQFPGLQVNEFDSRDALAAGLERVPPKCLALIAGGDGTVGNAAPVFIERDQVLGIVPTGTGNALAHELGIPIDPVQAVHFASEDAVEVRTDVGLANDVAFVTVATMGLSAAVGRELSELPKHRLGRLAYIPALLRAYRSMAPLRANICADGKALDGLFLQIVVAASQTHSGPFPATANAARDDRQFSVYAVRGANRAGLIKYGCSLLLGRHTSLPNVESSEAADVRIRCDKPRSLVVDGDPIHGAEFQFVMAKRQLRVLGSAASKRP